MKNFKDIKIIHCDVANGYHSSMPLEYWKNLTNMKDSKMLQLFRKIIQNFEIRQKMPKLLYGIILEHCLTGLPTFYLIF